MRTELESQFTERMLDGLFVNNVLRGSWAEQVVAGYLGAPLSFAEQWNYFDLRWNGVSVSVKHSVNPTARFSVARHRMAFDAELGRRRGPLPYTLENPEGWLGHEIYSFRQHWCDLYVFAWLPAKTSNAVVLDPASWQFTALSRAEMYSHFPETAKSVGQQYLAKVGHGFVPGAELATVANERLHSPTVGIEVPVLDTRTREEVLSQHSLDLVGASPS